MEVAWKHHGGSREYTHRPHVNAMECHMDSIKVSERLHGGAILFLLWKYRGDCMKVARLCHGSVMALLWRFSIKVHRGA